MRTILICICSVIFFQQTLAQYVSANQTNSTGIAYNTYDISGRPFTNSYIDISGSPYVNEGWKMAELDLGDGKKVAGMKIKINGYSNEIHFLAANNQEFTTPAGVVRTVRFIDSALQPPALKLYQCGFPAIENLVAESFYEVLSVGKATLLKSELKKVEEIKEEMSGEKTRQFQTYENLYVFQNGTISRLKKDKSALMEMMADQKEKIDAFVTAEKINFKNPESLKKLFDYYNGLSK